jgi:lysyl-tRNA synthetase class 2
VENAAESALIRQRADKLNALKSLGVDAYPTSFNATHSIAEAVKAFGSLTHDPARDASQGPGVKLAGRLMSRRDMGKACFSSLRSGTASFQVYFRKDVVGESAYKTFLDMVDLGDVLGVSGNVFRTKTNELTVRVTEWKVLSKSLRPWPEKWHGLSDIEIRSRQRELDLGTNAEVQERFRTRSALIMSLRQSLIQRGFLEVETPLMQAIPGGAAAKPFITHHEALDIDLYLRVAPELYLKRLLVGGIERVFEIGRAFRNEGIDTRHNPEFTLLESYQAYTDYQGVAGMTESLLQEAAAALGRDTFTYRGRAVSLKKPFDHSPLPELFKRHARLDLGELCATNAWREAAIRCGIKVDEETPDRKCFDRIFDERILPHLEKPTFVMDYPSVFSPLAKMSRSAPGLSERFELFIAGEEIANAYSEQNDPQVQRRRLEEELKKRRAGDAEAMVPDEDFLLALEHGMPPAGGLGIGIDRLTMILTGSESIREVILFPLLKPK